MKKLILIAAIIGLSLSAMAQKQPVAPPNPKDTTKYVRIIKVLEADYVTLLNLALSYKDGVIYNPNISDKIKEQQDVDMWLFALPKRILIDSVKVK